MQGVLCPPGTWPFRGPFYAQGAVDLAILTWQGVKAIRLLQRVSRAEITSPSRAIAGGRRMQVADAEETAAYFGGSLGCVPIGGSGGGP